jgi:TetR/AcrR family transcriptional regulator, cholesterol catabolism regulator
MEKMAETKFDRAAELLDLRPASLRAPQLARKKRIVAAAIDLAERGGYDAVQMRDVAKRANVALGTLYRYFPSKDQLLASVWIDWSHEIEAEILRQRLRGDTAAERIMDFVRRVTKALELEPMLASALVKSLLAPDVSAEESRQEMRAMLGRVIDEELSEMPTGTRVDIRDIIGQVFYANIVLWVNGRMPVERLYENMATACRLLLEHRQQGVDFLTGNQGRDR